MTALHDRLTRIALQELTGQAYATVDDQAAAMAAVMINNAEGYAVVELPEPLVDMQPFGLQWSGEDWSAYRDSDMVCTTSKVGLTPTAAREYAAGLLAAAAAAEAGAE